MLVTYVLRNIVLPQLRSAAGASTAAAAGGITSSPRATISTSVRHARSAEALIADRDEIRWEPLHVRHHDAPRVHLMPRPAERRQLPKIGEMKEGVQPPNPPVPSRDPTDRAHYPQQHTPQHTEPNTGHAPKGAARTTPVTDNTTPCARADLPPVIAKLLHAKLYRLTVFRVLDTPEYLADAPLVTYILLVLEKNGAGKLASRLRHSFEVPTRTPDGKVRLLSAPKSNDRRPPDYWRMPLVPRSIDAFPEPTRQERLTHAHNLTITRLLTVTHPIPYDSPFPRTRTAPLRRLRDVLHHVEGLRQHRGFVPDRVTANIIIKAWLSCLARATSRGERGLTREDLRDIFQLVSDSFNTKSAPLDEAAWQEQTTGREGLAKAGEDSSFKSKKDVGTEPAVEADSATPFFDYRVDYERHVEPFAKMMVRAMVRVGDHAGRKRVEKWCAGMAKKLGVEEVEMPPRRGKKSNEPHI